jgi:hypothetical protein
MNSDSSAAIAQAEALIASGDEAKLWEGAALLGEFASAEPEAIWPIVLRFASSDDAEIRMAIACCVLEHILEHHFEPYFAESQRLIAAGNPQFAATFSSCWDFGQTEQPENKRRFNELVQHIRTQNA